MLGQVKRDAQGWFDLLERMEGERLTGRIYESDVKGIKKRQMRMMWREGLEKHMTENGITCEQGCGGLRIGDNSRPPLKGHDLWLQTARAFRLLHIKIYSKTDMNCK